jgi:hypothetical protein
MSISGKDLDKLREMIQELEISEFQEFEQILEAVSKLIDQLNDAWSGHWFKAYANLYFHNLKKPPANALIDPTYVSIWGLPEGWIKLDRSIIDKIIEENIEFDFELVKKKVTEHGQKASNLCDHLCIELSLIKSDSKVFHDEIKELEKLELFEWGISPHSYINLVQPKNMIGNLRDFQSGVDVPPHIEYHSQIIYLRSTISSITEFIKKSKGLIRRIEIKSNISQESPVSLDAIESVVRICESFHTVSRP